MRVTATIIAACAGLAAAAFGGAASAQTTAYYQFQPGTIPSTVDHIDLTMQVTAVVSPGCGFVAAPSATFTHPNFDQTGFTDTVPFQLDCNGPFRIGVSSANGGMQGPAGALPAGYANLADYTVALTLVANSGGPYNINCLASQLRTAGGGCDTANANGFRANPATNLDGYRVPSASQGQTGSQIVLSRAVQPTSTVLVNGSYQDILTVTIAAAP